MSIATRGRAPQTNCRTSVALTVWAPVVVTALIPLFLLLGRDYRIGDPDTFWHVRAGDYLLETWRFVGPDPWSPFSAHPWVLHEWLSELAMAAADRIGGLSDVAWLWYTATVGVAAALYVACRRHGRITLAAIFTVLGLLGAASSLTPRPQLVSIGLAAVFTGAWLSSALDGRPRWWLVPVTWVWACAHGMWFLSPAIGAAVVVGLAVTPDRRRDVKRLALVVGASVAAAAVTPVGPALLLAPLSVSGYTRFVSEWDPPRLSSAPVAVTFALLALVALTWTRSRRRPSWSVILVWVLAVGAGVAYTRTVAIAAAMAAPLAVLAISDALPPEPLAARPVRRLEVWVIAVSALVCVAAAPLVLRGGTAVPDRMPTALDVRLDQLPAGTVLFDEYGLGGWLRYQHPDLVPVIDERTEIFTTDYVEAYVSARAADHGWVDFLQRTHATAALVPTDGALADALPRALGWRLAGTDRGYSLLVSPELSES